MHVLMHSCIEGYCSLIVFIPWDKPSPSLSQHLQNLQHQELFLQYSAKQLDMSPGLADSLGPVLAPAAAAAPSPVGSSGPAPATSSAGAVVLQIHNPLHASGSYHKQ